MSSREQWLPINKADQVRLIGNSVCPDEAEALVAANSAHITVLQTLTFFTCSPQLVDAL
jgi:DNA (cytosine-5)-methyltransferase 1